MSETIEAGDDLAGKRAKFEAEKLSRRQALRRFGFRAAGAVLAAFTVDDLAHAVISRMEKEKMMRGMTDGIAKEFKNAGVAFANSGIPSDKPCSGAADRGTCKTCCEERSEGNSVGLAWCYFVSKCAHLPETVE